MASNLAASQHDLIDDMVLSKSLTPNIAETAGCSECSVRAIRSNLRYFNITKTPPNDVERPRNITPLMLAALREHLFKKSELY
jgi:hypothetical protein